MPKLPPHNISMEPDILVHGKSKKLVMSGSSWEYPGGEFAKKAKPTETELMGAGHKKHHKKGAAHMHRPPAVKKALKSVGKRVVKSGAIIGDNILGTAEDTTKETRKRAPKALVDKAEVSLAGSGAAKPKRPPGKWIIHVKAYWKEHGGSYKDAMKNAKATYKK